MANSNRFFEGFLVGGILGFLGGILFAPKSGSELRKQLADSSDEMYRQASTGMHDLKDRTEQALHDFQAKSDTMLKQANAQLQETKDQLTTKFQDLSGKKVALQEPEQSNHM